MKSATIIALMVVCLVFAVDVAYATINADGTLTINKEAGVFPASRLSPNGTKKKKPVKFNHDKHGEGGCQVCHHQEQELKAGATVAKSCFECHGPETKGNRLDSFDIIHGKTGRCLACHRALKEKAVIAPIGCVECHGEGGTE